MTEAGWTDEEFLAWIDSPPAPLTTGPAGVTRDANSGQRIRPRLGQLKRRPRSLWVAEIVCPRVTPRPSLVALVLGSPKRRHAVLVASETEWALIGQDLLAACRCGLDHAIDGDRLRTHLQMITAGRRPRRTPRIAVEDVERRSRMP